MYPVFIFISIFLACAYALLMGAYAKGWRSLPTWPAPVSFVPGIRITVVIPARNEADNIITCLKSITASNYPTTLLEILVIDDYSEDATPRLVQDFSRQFPQVKLLKLADFFSAEAIGTAFKKKCLEVAIANARGEIIITTDADCTMGPDWLLLIASVFERLPEVQLVTAPVNFYKEHNLLQRFQSLDFLGLMGITGAGIHSGLQRMGNGANLAYRKSVFQAVGGFSGNEQHASGDDMFLIQKVAAQYSQGVFFLKQSAATVFTEAKPDWRSFLQQRLRWGTKNAALPEWPVRLALAMVFLCCWSILINILAAILFNHNWLLIIFQILVKAIADYCFLRMLCIYFNRRDLLRWFWPSFVLHTLYIAGVGLGSLFFKQFVWKGRRVR